MNVFSCRKTAFALILGLSSGAAFAVPRVEIGDGTAAAGATASVSLDYFSDGAVASGDFTFSYDPAFVTPTLNCAATLGTLGHTVACNDTGTAIQVLINAPVTFPIPVAPDGSLGSIGFLIAAGQMDGATSPLTITSENYFNGLGGGVTPDPADPSQNGSVTVQAGPGPGILNVQPPTLALTAEVGGAAGTGIITISNDGDPATMDATITPSCSLGAVTGGGTISVSAAPASLAAGASGTVTASCSGAAAGTSTADYTCSATSSGTPVVTNATTAITCVVAVGTPAPNPVAGSAAAISIGPVVRGNSGIGGLVFRETNASGGTYDVACVLTDDGAGAFAISGAASATVSSMAPYTFSVTGQSSLTDPQPTGSATCTYSGGATGAVTVSLGIQLIPEIVPTMSEWGLIILTLALVGFGAFQLRRRSPLA